MALHPDFPKSPYAILDPNVRWFPADENLREAGHEKLLPPLVHTLRREVKAWRDRAYAGASPTSQALLQWWFETEHLLPQSDGSMFHFQYYFAQREAVETIIYLHDVVKVKDKHDLMRFDAAGVVSGKMFDETWQRYVIKMATGSGKTKVLSLLLAWCYFHKLYEPESTLARNFLLIAPNIIVLDRIRTDFEGLRIFFADPVLPDNGYAGQNWRDDFQLSLHIQDEVNVTRKTGNIFLTNIHRIYTANTIDPSADDDNTMDYFLGIKPSGNTNDSGLDLGEIVREVDELVVLNDEAHHIHDSSMAWFKSIQDIHHHLLQKEKHLSLQIDVTATPRHNNGAIFVQTVADYPLVEAIYQDVVKHPLLPDKESREKLQERQSARYTEKYADYLSLGVEEWRKAYAEHESMGKKAILFVMTDDTKNCDDVADYLQKTYPDLDGKVLVIHTKNNGEISEAQSGKKKEELDKLRKDSNAIDSWESPYQVIVSVLMLKEGWDVRNVTTIVGLRAYSSKSNILPEQTLGRGLRRMYFGSDTEETVSVVGTDAFMDFVESIKAEGVELEHVPMGGGSGGGSDARLMVEVEHDNPNKDLEALDIRLPLLTARTYREYKHLDGMDVTRFGHTKVVLQHFSEDEQREIVFKDIATDEVSHTTTLDSLAVTDYRSVLGYFAQLLMKDLRLVSGYDVLYGKLKAFVRDELFTSPVDLEERNTLRNLADMVATKTLLDAFRKAINNLTVQDKGSAEIRDYLYLSHTRPFRAKNQAYLVPTKSIFNRIIGDSSLELKFAGMLEQFADVQAFAKNYLSVHFQLDYIRADGAISNYYPDFIVKMTDGRVIIIETKGLEDVDVAPKMQRLKQWCEDVNSLQFDIEYGYLFVDEKSLEQYKPKSLQSMLDSFRAYR